MPKRGGRKKFSTPEEIEAQRLEIKRMSLGDMVEEDEKCDMDGVGMNKAGLGSTSAKKEDSSDDESADEEVRAKGFVA